MSMTQVFMYHMCVVTFEGRRIPYVYQVLKFVGLPFGRYGAFSVSALIGLERP